MKKPRVPTSALAAAALCLAAILPSCSTSRAGPPAAPPPRLRVAQGRATPLDQHSVRLPFLVELENPRAEPLSLESFEAVLLAEGSEAARVSGAEAREIGAGASSTLALEFVADARALGAAYAGPEGPSEAPCRVEARIVLRDPRGVKTEARASADGLIPIVREPRLEIVALEIERDRLVTTKLRLSIEARNPNAFPVSMGSFRYAFDGEGKPWAEGSDAGPFRIAARSSARIELAFEMNFADRADRKLLDLVAGLGVVRYRLAGDAAVVADLGFPLAFPLKYDESGSCRVER